MILATYKSDAHPFFDLLRRNVAGLVENFWAAGYVNVGPFVSGRR